jgi:ketosteroid isomerase-like protein/quercetin dioxygenase-like cupin family protein
MRRLASLIVASVLAASCAQTVNVEQERTALMALDSEWSGTVKDVDKYLTYFAPDATFRLAGMPPLKGVPAIRTALEPMIKAPGFNVGWKAESAEVSAAGDLGYTAGSYTLTATNAAGNPATEKGTYVTVWKKINGAWKVIDDAGGSIAPPAVSSAHVIVPSSAIKWGDPPPSVPKGAKIAAISGDPTKPEMFTIRLQFPAGYRIPPHWHPTDEHVTVISGTFAAGMGKAWDDKTMGDLPAGSYAVLPATMPHYALAKTAAVVQVSGMGPFILNYVNPADDPSK